MNSKTVQELGILGYIGSAGVIVQVKAPSVTSMDLSGS